MFLAEVYCRLSRVENPQIRTGDICLLRPGTNVPKAWPYKFGPKTLVAKNEELTPRLRVWLELLSGRFRTDSKAEDADRALKCPKMELTFYL